MPPMISRPDLDMPVGILVGAILILGCAVYAGETALLATLLTFTGAVGTLFGFALLNAWLQAGGAGGRAKVMANLAGVAVLLVGVALTDLFFAVAGNLAAVAACLTAATARGR